jgi:hypothetical protein
MAGEAANCQGILYGSKMKNEIPNVKDFKMSSQANSHSYGRHANCTVVVP